MYLKTQVVAGLYPIMRTSPGTATMMLLTEEEIFNTTCPS